MTARNAEIVQHARTLLERDGWHAVTMRGLGAHLGIKAASLYKHVAGKPALAAQLTAVGLCEIGASLHSAVAAGEGVRGVLTAYRAYTRSAPNLYRLATSATFDRQLLPEGLEEWTGTPFFTVTADPYLAQALWAAAHGLAILEIDRRFPTGAAPDETWARAAAAFASQAPSDPTH